MLTCFWVFYAHFITINDQAASKKTWQFSHAMPPHYCDVTWRDETRNEVILQRTDCSSLFSYLKTRRLPWFDHVVWLLLGCRLPNDIPFVELISSTRSVGWHHLHFRDVVKRNVRQHTHNRLACACTGLHWIVWLALIRLSSLDIDHPRSSQSRYSHVEFLPHWYYNKNLLPPSNILFLILKKNIRNELIASCPMKIISCFIWFSKWNGDFCKQRTNH